MSNLITNSNFLTDTTGWIFTGAGTAPTPPSRQSALPTNELGTTTGLKIFDTNNNIKIQYSFTVGAGNPHYIRFYIRYVGPGGVGTSPITARIVDNSDALVTGYDVLINNSITPNTWYDSTSFSGGTNSLILTPATTYKFQISTSTMQTNDAYIFTDVYVGTTTICFNKGTKILSLRNNIEMYIPIEELNKETDLVKTHLHGFKKINNIGHSVIVNDTSDFTKSMYIMEKTNDMIDDLIVTGGHSILEDKYETAETEAIHKELFGGELDPIDDKVLVLAGKSSKFRQIDNKETYDIYHIALGEDESEDKRYGIWANGVLTESTFKKVLYKMISFN